MSWAEVYKINNNFSKSLNEQMRENRFMGAYLFTSSATWTVPQNGWYKVVCVGKPGTTSSSFSSSNVSNFNVNIGGAGGVAIKNYEFTKNANYPITINGAQSTFNVTLIANAGNSNGTGGTASGGDYNYQGTSGGSETTYVNSSHVAEFNGADVGIYIPEICFSVSKQGHCSYAEMPQTASSSGYLYTADFEASSGIGILGYGASSGFAAGNVGYSYCSVYAGKDSGCVLIIPLELK